jgi:hypothetical protein
MLIANQSFSAVYDGEMVAVHRGKTRLSVAHDLACRFPNRFSPDRTDRRADFLARVRQQFGDGIDEAAWAKRFDEYESREAVRYGGRVFLEDT